MKKIAIVSLFLLSFISFAQKDNDSVKRNELKVNAFNLVALNAVDFSYEYLLDTHSSVGASFFINLKDDDLSDFEDFFDFYYPEKFAFTPYYRYNFLNRYTKAFFIEGFGMYNVQKNFKGSSSDFDNGFNPVISDLDETSNNVAVGVSIGGKFVSRGGFVFELYGGIGRNIYTSDDKIATEVVRRIGASIGFRF